MTLGYLSLVPDRVTHPKETSMSDYAHDMRNPPPTHAVESRAMFAAFYVLFLMRAVLTRMLPWRRDVPFRDDGARESVFGEARISASVMVSSSFMGM